MDAVSALDQNMLDLKMIGVKKVTGGTMRDSFLVDGVAFKKTFSYAGFEQQPKHFQNPKVRVCAGCVCAAPLNTMLYSAARCCHTRPTERERTGNFHLASPLLAMGWEANGKGSGGGVRVCVLEAQPRCGRSNRGRAGCKD